MCRGHYGSVPRYPSPPQLSCRVAASGRCSSLAVLEPGGPQTFGHPGIEASTKVHGSPRFPVAGEQTGGNQDVPPNHERHHISSPHVHAKQPHKATQRQAPRAPRQAQSHSSSARPDPPRSPCWLSAGRDRSDPRGARTCPLGRPPAIWRTTRRPSDSIARTRARTWPSPSTQATQFRRRRRQRSPADHLVQRRVRDPGEPGKEARIAFLA